MRIKPLFTLFFALFVGTTSVHAQVILGSRLVGTTNKVYGLAGFTPIDSFSYHYTGAHTSFMKTGLYQYDSAIRYLYQSGVYSLYEKSTQGFNGNDSIFIGNLFRWDTTSTWKSYSGYNKTFGVNGLDSQKITLSSSSGMLQPEYQYLYYYNPSGNMTLELRGSYNGTSYDSNMKTIYTYNTHNDIVKTEIYDWDFPSNSYKINEEKDHEYDTTSHLLTNYFHKSKDFSTGVLKLDAFTMYYYDAGKRVVAIDYNEYNSGVMGVIPTGHDTLVYDDSSNLTTVINQSFDFSSGTYSLHKKYTWEYNVHNDPTIYLTYTWVSGTWINQKGQDNETNYYYNDYTNSVNNIAKQQGQLQIYPIPARNLLNVAIKWNMSQPFSINLYDMQGRLVQKWDENAASSFKQTLSIPGLQNGNYVVVVKGANDQKMTQQIVVE